MSYIVQEENESQEDYIERLEAHIEELDDKVGLFAGTIMELKERHEQVYDQLKLITDAKDVDFKMGGGEKGGEELLIEIKAGTDKHKGLIVGVIIAREMIGKFPVEVVGGA